MGLWISIFVGVLALLLAFSLTMMHTYERSRCEYRAEVAGAEHDFHLIYGCTIH